MPTIEVSGIGKRYAKKGGNLEALKEVSFQVQAGELFGLIGPDGAGKTSLFRILVSLLLPDAGSATVCGLDVVRQYEEVRQVCGYMPGRFSLYQDLSVEENLEFFAAIYDTKVSANYDLIRDIYGQIEPFRKRRAGKLSGGMKQKLALSCALIHRPRVLILDEPTTGVDAVSRKEFWQILKRLQEEGMSILVSTPYMDEAGLCDRVALIQEGRILSVDTPAGIVNQFGQDLWSIRSDNLYRLLQDLREYPDCESVFPFGDSLHMTLQSGTYDQATLLSFLQSRGHRAVEVRAVKPGVEDVFMKLMRIPAA